MDTYRSGLLAEMVAVVFLSVKLYRVIARRYKTHKGEIDIIAIRGKTLIFIEVKKRADRHNLFDSITPRQRKRITNSAELFLAKNSKYDKHQKRFDVVLVTPDFLPIHIKNAW